MTKGKQRFIWGLLLLVAVFLCLAVKREARGQAKSAAPELKILSPRPGQTFDDTPIFIQLAVRNFKLVAPVVYFGKPGPQNVGHIHIILDEQPLIATAETQLMIGKMAGAEYLPEGKHTLYVELSVDNHDSLTPPVRRKVTFYTMHPGRGTGNHLGSCRSKSTSG